MDILSKNLDLESKLSLSIEKYLSMYYASLTHIDKEIEYPR